MSLSLFLITYLGIALGKVPGLVIDRVGIALLGAIAMVGFGVISTQAAVQAIDLPTILLLYSLMIISAQLRLGGFYTWSASRILSLLTRNEVTCGDKAPVHGSSTGVWRWLRMTRTSSIPPPAMATIPKPAASQRARSCTR